MSAVLQDDVQVGRSRSELTVGATASCGKGGLLDRVDCCAAVTAVLLQQP
jgi:hypothetical protein